MKGLTIVDDNAVSESTDIVIDRLYNSFTVFPLDYIDITETNRYSTTKEIRIKIENLIHGDYNLRNSMTVTLNNTLNCSFDTNYGNDYTLVLYDYVITN
jgi:hypothetical protein